MCSVRNTYTYYDVGVCANFDRARVPSSSRFLLVLKVGIGQGLQYSAYGFTINYSKMLMMPCGLPFLLKALKSQKDKEAASG